MLRASPSPVFGSHKSEKRRLVNSDSRGVGYGSVLSSEARQKRPLRDLVDQEAISSDEEMQIQGDRREVTYRRITARTVHLPKQKWYRKIRIPGVYNKSSPHSNVVHTTKYTIITFIPKNLWEQFHRFALLYFLFIALLNFVPAVQAFGREVGFIPLLFVVTVTAIKDVFEDYRRYRSDREVNSKLCRVYDWDMGAFVQRYWRDVRVGDFVELECDEVIPADILLLASTDPHHICYIETANIDGETNLKQRQIVPGTVEYMLPLGAQSHFNPLHFSGELFAEQPHPKIYEFNGFVDTVDGTRLGVDKNNLLLRGCVLRNTTRVAGMVVYAGHQTKALLNNSGPRAKRSKLDRDINVDVFSLLIILLVICIIGSIGTAVWTAMNVDKNIPYFPYTYSNLNPILEGFIRFWTYIIIYQVIVPVSLYVTVVIVQFIQVYFINWDVQMYYDVRDTPFQSRALNINEDLGQIQYVFSDKTGTLTENEMMFKCCSIGGKNYLHNLSAESAWQGSEATSNSQRSTEETDFPTPPQKPMELDEALLSDIQNPTLSETYIQDFFVVMALCNTVVVTGKSHIHSIDEAPEFITAEHTKPGEMATYISSITYEAESPDEAALVEAARCYGYALVSRSPGKVVISTPSHQLLAYDVLHVLEFDTERKCMSVIVREVWSSRIILYSKGAETVIFSNLAHPSGVLVGSGEESAEGEMEDEGDSCVGGEDNGTLRELTEQHLTNYAKQGLRTLCMAKRILSAENYHDWVEERREAEVSLEGREGKLFQTAKLVETQLELLGATGIEDRLQDGVPETIESLRKAGMQIWVLTGDKQETAINIGYSSSLIDGNMDVIVVNASSSEATREILLSRKQELDAQGVEEGSTHSWDSVFSRRPLVCRREQHGKRERRVSKALVIDGGTLHFALQPALKLLFLDVAKCCDAVICSRSTPIQKAAVVDLVKSKLKKMTLAIGDGANDVSMIQTAHVGVGLSGKEGMQAVMASDFAMARFKFLERLLLVHGHWSYGRMARMILYFFYKNTAYAMLLFWFQIFNAFSGSNPIDGINLTIFNLVYTSLPIMVVGVADQDLRADTLLKHKFYYDQGRCSRVYTRWMFWLTMIDAFYQSAAIFFLAYGAYYTADVGVAEFGFVINITAVVVVSFHLAVETLHWTVVNHIILWGSVVFTFIFNYVYTAIDTKQEIMDTYWLMQMTSTRPVFWFILLLAPVVCLFPRVIAKVIEQEFFASSVFAARADEKRSHKRSKTVEVSANDATVSSHVNSHPL